MATQRIFLKSAHVGTSDGPFTITDNLSNVLASNVTRAELLNGIYVVADTTSDFVTITSGGTCNTSETVYIYPTNAQTTTTSTTTIAP